MIQTRADGAVYEARAWWAIRFGDGEQPGPVPVLAEHSYSGHGDDEAGAIAAVERAARADLDLMRAGKLNNWCNVESGICAEL